MTLSLSLDTRQGLEDRLPQEALAVTAAIGLDQDRLPAGFPMHQWNWQMRRYREYWSWYTGQRLNETIEGAQGPHGEPAYKFPLKINTIVNFARKHASLLFGEVPDTANPLVRTLVTPKQPFDGSLVNEGEERAALFCQNLINEVWQSSHGRALQMEAGILSQFLGGCVFKVCWQPWRTDLLVPVVIQEWPVDFFLPIWRSDDYFSLMEAFLVMRVNSEIMRQQFGIQPQGQYSTYLEHWKRDSYSIYIDGQPLQSDFTGEMITYKDEPNPFGFVPFVYIPHLREGNFYGTSIVEDIKGLVLEYNGRMADFGDGIHDTIQRRRYGTNLPGAVRERKIGESTRIIDLGQQPPGVKDPPKVEAEDPPQLSQGFNSFLEVLHDQLLREGSISTTAFGEDEGSQRSALTLAFRMWPSTSHARAEQSFWSEGLQTIAKMILGMVSAKGLFKGKIPPDFSRRFDFTPDWQSQIPRDRESKVNEVVLRVQAGLMSPQKALEEFGDVRNIDQELEQIREWLTFQSSLQIKQQNANTPGGAGSGAPTELATPKATTGTKEQS